MKSILVAIVTCLILFGLSAGASWYLQQNQEKPTDDSELEASMVDTSLTSNDSFPNSPEDQIERAPQMPVGQLPSSSDSMNAVLQLGQSLKTKQANLDRRELQVRKEEQRVQLLFADLEQEQNDLKAFSEGVEAKLVMLEQLMKALNEAKTELERKNKEIVISEPVGAQANPEKDLIAARVAQTSSWFENVEPAQAAEYLKGFANRGKLDFAAALLQEMNDRQKSKILSELNDPTLVSQLIDALDIPRDEE